MAAKSLHVRSAEDRAVLVPGIRTSRRRRICAACCGFASLASHGGENRSLVEDVEMQLGCATESHLRMRPS